jgi:hypothetical protein
VDHSSGADTFAAAANGNIAAASDCAGGGSLPLSAQLTSQQALKQVLDAASFIESRQDGNLTELALRLPVVPDFR